ncbi:MULTISPECIES: tail protein X [unclassified Paraburkholderia]|uniref:tail protein X n=1 Tax=unclassified Paraburkholderia TaxID=2615204 RepID=UPI00160CCE65|nr:MULTISPECIES: tail protein X [unclassified Paraburkholderia]MBB5447091.1 phage tail protein X [Paraburkholderia sp. WSM4177]MBB5487632.1 phage tail protein X [Paraburkholderia sp. WSM4180]
MNVRALQGETIDAMCWRIYGRTDGVVEAVLEANPGLAAQGVFLPAGFPVSMPDPTGVTGTAQLVQLFD